VRVVDRHAFDGADDTQVGEVATWASPGCPLRTTADSDLRLQADEDWPEDLRTRMQG